ncbi:MAG: hypothetical protein FJX76_15285 [Armatimonadetes bacterium]|nr:hypothetical protein [Armatimonadota bacterium]
MRHARYKILLAVLIIAAGCARPPASEGGIRVGVILPLTGPQATFGRMQKNGYDMAAEEINKKGGVLGRRLEVLYEDDQGKPDAALAAVEKLITREKVVALMGSFNSNTTVAAAGRAESYKIPFVVPCAASDDLTRQKYAYVFRLNAPSSVYASTTLDAVLAKLPDIKRIAICHESSLFGSSAARDMVKVAGQHGLEISGLEQFEKGASDFKPMLTRIKGQNPDMIFMIAYETDAILMMRQSREIDLSPRVFAGGGAGFTLPEFIEGAGPLAEHVVSVSQWDGAVPWPGAAEYTRRYKETFKEIPEYHSAETYAAVFVIEDALKRARGTAPDAIRDGIRACRINGVFGPISFEDYDGFYNQNRHEMVVLQIQNAAFVPVFPKDLATGTLNLPVPSWREREGGRAASPGYVLPQVILDGIFTGGLYALIGMGLTLIFGVMRIVNFAHGELMMVGMYVTWLLFASLGVDPFVSVLASFPVAFLLGAGIQRVVLRRAMNAPPQNQILLTLGTSLVISNTVLLIFSPNYRSVSTWYSASVFHVGPLTVSTPRAIAFAITMALTFGLYQFLTRTDFGLALRATAQDGNVARLMGIDVDTVRLFTFGLGAALAATAGSLLAPVFPNISPTVGGPFTLKAFVVVVLGGMGSVAGATWGGLLLGVVEALGATFLSNAFKDVFAFAIFLAILLIRPQGLLGKTRL